MKRVIAVILTVLMAGCVAFPAFASPVDSETTGSTVIVLDGNQYILTKASPYAPKDAYGPGATPGGWYQDYNTKRYYFVFLDGHRVYNQWEKITGKWYYFDINGFILQGQWLEWNGKWYYLGLDGAMYASCMTPDGHFVDKDGARIDYFKDPNKGPGAPKS